MKAFMGVLLAAVLLVQFNAALPRLKREAWHFPQSGVLAESADMTALEKIQLYGATELLKYANETLHSYQNFFDAFVKAAAKYDLKINKELSAIADFAKKVDETNGPVDKQHFDKVFALLDELDDVGNRFDLHENKHPTEAERAVAKLWEEHGVNEVYLQSVDRWFELRKKLIDRFQTFADAEQGKNNKFDEWFKIFKTQADFEKSLSLMYYFLDAIH